LDATYRLPFLTLALLILATGCRKDDFVGVVGICPEIISTSPFNVESSVPLGKILTATFNQKMDPTSISEGSFTLFQGTRPMEGSVSFAGSILSFTPRIPLELGSNYRCRVAATVYDFLGNSLPRETVWIFTTGIGPAVVSVQPAGLATAVPLAQVIGASFNQAMDSATLNAATFALTTGGHAVLGAVACTGSNATFTPAALLLSGVEYLATVTAGAKNLSGFPLAFATVWTFRTGLPAGPPLVDLASSGRFGILAGAAITSVGNSEIHDQDVGLSPGVRAGVTGFPPALLLGGLLVASDDASPVPGQLIQAKLDLTSAYLAAQAANLPAATLVAGDLGGQTLTPGLYRSASFLLVQAGDLTLDAQGDVNAVWIFQMATTLTTIGGGPGNGNVLLAGGAKAAHVFWQVGSSATLGDDTAFQGNILAFTSITMNSGATATGRLMALNGAVTLAGAGIIRKP
jgi:hypothetical protein